MNERPLPRILGKIRATKESEITELLKSNSESELLEMARERVKEDPARDFHGAVSKASKSLNLIAEVKKASPSKGLIRPDFNPSEIAVQYEQGGAAAISCLTDTEYFQGSLEFLKQTRAASGLPVMRKDFIIHPAQVMEARAAGADAFLLIARMLTCDELKTMLKLGEELGMGTLLEVHDEDDIEKALTAEGKLLGVNNRDLDTFVVDFENTFRLQKLIPQNIPLVAESGIFTNEEIVRLAEQGIKAALVGESLMRQDDVAQAVRTLLG